MRIVNAIFGNRLFPLVFPSDLALATAPAVFYAFYCIECIVAVLTTPLVIRFCHALDKSALFHRNLIIIVKYHFCATYMVQIVRILLIFFELGIISVGEEIRFPSVFVTLCYASLFFKTACVTLFPSAVFERSIASYYIDNYEAKSRMWVVATALILSAVLCACYTTVMIFGFAGIDKVCMFSTGVCIAFAIIMVILYRRDRRRLEKFVMKSSFCYELSTRFQLVENLRVLKIIMNASVAFSIWLPFPCIMLVLVYGWLLPNTHSGQIVYASFELILSLSIAGLFLFSVTSLGALPKKVQTLKCVKMFKNKVNNGDREPRGVVTEKYFQQLHSAWA